MPYLKEAFRQCHVLITPVAPTPASKIGEKIEDPLTIYLTDIFTVSPNLAGIPCMSIPYGMNSSGLPIRVQLLANYFDESTLIQAASALERTSLLSTPKGKGIQKRKWIFLLDGNIINR